ncbi:hypothetical protein KIL84_004565 [Mauremys mutica]|uniref:Uncharacterized protein n=1 Tax=Mauremys mutica TaxID=74926 RepID=A0A9D4B6G1_9SAUR|nr:hypothetical protein KIL84_004565 [Mauremys mutica]
MVVLFNSPVMAVGNKEATELLSNFSFTALYHTLKMCVVQFFFHKRNQHVQNTLLLSLPTNMSENSTEGIFTKSIHKSAMKINKTFSQNMLPEQYSRLLFFIFIFVYVYKEHCRKQISCHDKKKMK